MFSVSAAPGYAPIPFQQRPLQNGPVATPNGQQTHEMNIPNDLIGCIIGRGGQKINEIRYFCEFYDFEFLTQKIYLSNWLEGQKMPLCSHFFHVLPLKIWLILKLV